MERVHLLLILAISLLVPPSLLIAGEDQPPTGVEICDAPVWTPGDRWKYISHEDQVWEEFYFDIGTEGVKEGAFNFFPYAGLKIFPIWVGKVYEDSFTVHFTDMSRRIWRYSYRVRRLKQIKTAAGTFKCYEIEFRLMADILASRRGRARIYYSPETKSIVKVDGIKFLSSIMRFVRPLMDYELVSYSLGSTEEAVE
jgi:hypothetical protein